MKQIKIWLLISGIVLSYTTGFTQGEIPVDMFTGTPSINIPLWTVTDHDLSVPIGLSYTGDGLQLEEKAIFIGVGWQIYGGGSITRDVRGLPDDFDGIDQAKISGVNYDRRRGWLYMRPNGSAILASEVSGFASSADLSGSTCSDELADFNALNALQYSDTEPDVFYVNAPGITTSFVFDNSAAAPQIRFLTFTNISAEITRNTQGDIFSFKLTTPDQTTYEFTAISVEKKSYGLPLGAQVDYLRSDYSRYAKNTLGTDGVTYTGDVTYYREWMLTKITSPSGAYITFKYASKEFTKTTTRYLGIRKVDNSGFDNIVTISEYLSTNYRLVSEISGSSGTRVKAIYSPLDGLISEIEVYDDRRTNPFVKEFAFTHALVGPTYFRPFLQSLQERSFCAVFPPYSFSYTGVDLATGTSALPGPTSLAKDFWGYYNGKTNSVIYPTLYVYPSLPYPDKVRHDRLTAFPGTEIVLPGADRTPDASKMTIGTLNKIANPTGGTTIISYEPHQFLDPYSNSSVIGGGLRIKSMKYNDGLSATVIEKSFTYVDVNGRSTGRILNKPVFYIPTQRYKNGTTEYAYSTLAAMSQFDVFNRLLARVSHNVAFEEKIGSSNVAYTAVTVTRPGAGSSKHVFNLPGTYNTAASGSWIPTQVKFARSSTCPAIGILEGPTPWLFPYVPNTSPHFERGLLMNKSDYDESGQLVTETAYTYQTIYKTGTPGQVWGVRLEYFPNDLNAATIVSGKYKLITDATSVMSSAIQKVFSTPSNSLTTTTNYVYDPVHKNLKEVTTTGSDETIYKTRVKYAMDYPAVTGTSEPRVEMIRYMQTRQINVPIEVVNRIQRPNQVEKVSSARLTTFTPSALGKPLPYETLSLSIQDPVADFTESTIQAAATNTFQNDTRYEVGSRINTFDSFDQPISAENPETRSVMTSILGYSNSVPVAQVSDASPSQLAFADFETVTDVSFTLSAQSFGSGRTGAKSVLGSVKLTRTVSKANEANYWFAFWAKSGVAGSTVTLTIKSTGGTQLSTKSTTTGSTSGKFKYFRTSIPVSTLPASFVVEVTCSDANALLDDVAFYPESAQLSSTTMDIPFGATSVTDATGKSEFVQYDRLGRPTVRIDQDGNIIQRNTYTYGLLPDVLTSQFDLPVSADNIFYEDVALDFLAWEDCHEGVTYEWDFGAGYTVGTRAMSYVFPNGGNYTVSLRISAQGYPTVTTSKVISIRGHLTICAKGLKIYDPLTGTQTSYQPCSTLPAIAKPMETVFQISTGPVTVNWKYRNVGALEWQDGGTSTLFRKRLSASAETGYEVMCESIDDGVTNSSNVLGVYFINEIN